MGPSMLDPGTPEPVARFALEPLSSGHIHPQTDHWANLPREVPRRAMTDTVQQSYCERCGTLYTFDEQDSGSEATPETKPEGGLSKLGRTFKRRAGPDETAGSGASKPNGEGFDDKFHFCLQCRQYTCLSCWNGDAGYCQSCRPLDGSGAPEPDASTPVARTGAGQPAAPSAPGSWPSGDLERRSTDATAGPHDHVHAPATGPPRTGSKEGPSADPWGLGSSTRSGSGATETSAASQAPGGSDLPWVKDPAATGGDAEVDPWRGVVFSADGESTGAAETSDPPEVSAPQPPATMISVPIVSSTATPRAPLEPSIPATDATPTGTPSTAPADDAETPDAALAPDPAREGPEAWPTTDTAPGPVAGPKDDAEMAWPEADKPSSRRVDLDKLAKSSATMLGTAGLVGGPPQADAPDVDSPAGRASATDGATSASPTANDAVPGPPPDGPPAPPASGPASSERASSEPATGTSSGEAKRADEPPLVIRPSGTGVSVLSTAMAVGAATAPEEEPAQKVDSWAGLLDADAREAAAQASLPPPAPAAVPPSPPASATPSPPPTAFPASPPAQAEPPPAPVVEAEVVPDAATAPAFTQPAVVPWPSVEPAQVQPAVPGVEPATAQPAMPPAVEPAEVQPPAVPPQQPPLLPTTPPTTQPLPSTLLPDQSSQPFAAAFDPTVPPPSPPPASAWTAPSVEPPTAPSPPPPPAAPSQQQPAAPQASASMAGPQPATSPTALTPPPAGMAPPSAVPAQPPPTPAPAAPPVPPPPPPAAPAPPPAGMAPPAAPGGMTPPTPAPPPATAALLSMPPAVASQPLPPPTEKRRSVPLASSRGCGNCGLPLSAQAKFCRRCGKPQA